jgi:hypothetical protein
MKKSVVTLVWTVTFAAAYGLLSMLMFAILGFFGIVREPTTGRVPSYMWVFGVWAWLFWAFPLLGLVLSLRGILPGTGHETKAA